MGETAEDRRRQLRRDRRKRDGEEGKEERKDRINPYEKTLPFARDVPLLIHRMLRLYNLEYVFFTNEPGNKEIGVFLVLLENLQM